MAISVNCPRCIHVGGWVFWGCFGRGVCLVWVCVSWGVGFWVGSGWLLMVGCDRVFLWEGSQVGIGVPCAAFGVLLLAGVGCLYVFLVCLVIFVLWLSV